MEPIKLRGHHINNLIGYMLGSETFIEAYHKILCGSAPVKIVDKRDEVCKSCGCKRDGGCLHDDVFEPEEDISRADRVVANRFGLEIGNTYESRYLLEQLKLFE